MTLFRNVILVKFKKFYLGRYVGPPKGTVNVTSNYVVGLQITFLNPL